VRVFGQRLVLYDVIGSHACTLEANMRVTNGIPLGSPLALTISHKLCPNIKVDFYEYAKLVGLPLDRVQNPQELPEYNIRPKSMDDLATLSELAVKNAENELAADYTVLGYLYGAGLITQKCTGTADCITAPKITGWTRTTRSTWVHTI
jgi:hypothetical protein